MSDRIYIELGRGEAELARDALTFSLGFGGSDVPGADAARSALTKLKVALNSESEEASWPEVISVARLVDEELGADRLEALPVGEKFAVWDGIIPTRRYILVSEGEYP